MTIALAVSAIPEGLPVAITIALAVASARMARRHVIVRRLPAVEGLGSCTLIASDKTGTLTVNRLTVKRVVTASGTVFDVEGEGLDPHGSLLPAPSEGERDAVRRLAVAAALANEARLHSDNGAIEASGDSVDVAFLVLAAKLGLRRDELLAAEPQPTIIAYESSLGFSASQGAGQVRVKAPPSGSWPCAKVSTWPPRTPGSTSWRRRATGSSPSRRGRRASRTAASRAPISAA